jgi:hypothetical protein
MRRKSIPLLKIPLLEMVLVEVMPLALQPFSLRQSKLPVIPRRLSAPAW